MVADISRLHRWPGFAAEMAVEIEADSLIGIRKLGLMEGVPVAEDRGESEDQIEGEGDQGESETPVDQVCHRNAFPRPREIPRETRTTRKPVATRRYQAFVR